MALKRWLLLCSETFLAFSSDVSTSVQDAGGSSSCGEMSQDLLISLAGVINDILSGLLRDSVLYLLPALCCRDPADIAARLDQLNIRVDHSHAAGPRGAAASLPALGTEVTVSTIIQQVPVEHHPSAVNVTLPAFAAERRRLLHSAHSCRWISLPAGRSAANPPAAVAAVNRWDRLVDRQTDDRPLHRLPDPHAIRAASVIQ